MLRQETLNYWKQLNHVLKYFHDEDDAVVKSPQDFLSGFLEVLLTRLHRAPSASL